MRKHNEEFKNAINRFGRELDSKITFDETELGNEQLNAVTPVLKSAMLKSVMKELDIDSNVDIPVGTIINYKFGVLIDDENYEYLDYGNYQVYSSKKQEDTNSYNIVAYDKMLNSMVDYTTLKDTSKAFPMTIKDYISAICNDINIVFKDKTTEFVNYNKIIQTDLYANLGYTYRDILDELAQVTASNIIINENDELEIKYITDTEDTIDEEYLKDINVAFGEKYGPINSIVLSRSAGSDNVYLQDEQSVADNGLCELKISDNQIMNFNDRSDYLPQILEKLNGLEFYINDFSSTGICYYEVADKYNVKIGEITYPCVMFNDEIDITQGLEENIYTELPEQAETDYTKADKTDRRINQTYLIVDKQNQQIQSLVSTYLDFLQTKNSNGSIYIEDVYANGIVGIEITGEFSLLYPEEDLYPSDDLYPLSSELVIEDENGNKKYYELNIGYLESRDIYKYNYQFDENLNQFVATAQILRKNGSIENIEAPIFTMPSGNYKIYMLCFDNLSYKCDYIIHNDLTNVLATNTQLSTSITQTRNYIDLKAQQSVNKDDIVADLNIAIEDGQGVIKFKSNTITIDSDNCKLDEKGNLTVNNGTFSGKIEGSTLRLYDDVDLSIPSLTITTITPEGYTSRSLATSTIKGNHWLMEEDIGDIEGGYVEINTHSGLGEISLNGSVFANDFLNNSKEEYKKNLKKFENALQIINSTDIYKYNYKNENDSSKKHIGLVIGDGYNYSKEITNNDNNSTDLYSMISVCFQAIKEQQQEIEKLKEKIERKENKYGI